MPNGAGRVAMLTPLSPLVKSTQRYAIPHRIWPSASVIIKKLIPVVRNANTANTAEVKRVANTAPAAAAAWAKPACNISAAV